MYLHLLDLLGLCLSKNERTTVQQLMIRTMFLMPLLMTQVVHKKEY